MLDIHAGYDGDLIKETSAHQFIDRFLHIFAFVLKHPLHTTIQHVLEASEETVVT